MSRDRSSPTIIATERQLDLPDLASTQALGRRLAACLKVGDLIRLDGDLGAGKSELARAVIQARAGSPIDVPSPTFTLVQSYELPGLTVVHADLYRVAVPEEVEELGLLDAAARGALLVEWAERGSGVLPDAGLAIALEHVEDDDARRVTLAAGPVWLDRLDGLLP